MRKLNMQPQIVVLQADYHALQELYREVQEHYNQYRAPHSLDLRDAHDGLTALRWNLEDVTRGRAKPRTLLPEIILDHLRHAERGLDINIRNGEFDRI